MLEPLTHRWARRLMLDRHAEHWLGELAPLRSLSQARARVERVVAETPDTRTFFLRPNRHWRGHRAGQFTTVELEIDGVRRSRCYSISSAPGEALLSITVKRVPSGRVSGWLHDRVGPGAVLGLGSAAGDFVLPERPPERLLLYSGGSGITPVMSILRHLSRRDAVHDVVFVHHARTRRDVIFLRELEALAARHRGLRIALRLSDQLGDAPRFDARWLAAVAPDFAERATFLCGPPGLMDQVERTWDAAGASALLRRERFVVPSPSPPPAGASPASEAGQATVVLARSGRHLAVDATRPLLEQLERAGERPAHGCRMGICNTCACRKRSGTVRNLVTGAQSSRPDEEIRLCISAPESDVELAL